MQFSMSLPPSAPSGAPSLLDPVQAAGITAVSPGYPHTASQYTCPVAMPSTVVTCAAQAAVPGQKCVLRVVQAQGSHSALVPTLLVLPNLKDERKPSPLCKT